MSKGQRVNNTCADKELILLIQRGDKDAFTFFYERHRVNMYLSAYHLLRDEDDANDVVQELFTEVWEHANKINPLGNIKGYLYTILRNRILTAMSRSKYFDTFVNSYLKFEAHNSTSTEDTVLVRDLTQLLEEKVNELSPKMREVYELSWKEDLTNKQIAERMQISEGTVKQHKHHAYSIIRNKLQRMLFFLYL